MAMQFGGRIAPGPDAETLSVINEDGEAVLRISPVRRQAAAVRCLRALVVRRLQATRVAALPVRNEKGHYDTETDPLPASSAELTNFIRDRSAARSQHIQRQRNRRGGRH
jgi:hypothetical protein